MRIAVAGLHTECSTYNPVLIPADAFRVLRGEALLNDDYFGYLIPSWSVGANEPDTIMGTVLRSDPANPSASPLIASFAATREAVAAPKAAPAPKTPAN